MKFGGNNSVIRREDQRFITGKGRYTDDLSAEGQAIMVLLRSPHARARIAGIDLAEASEADGVLAVITGDDLAAWGVGTMKPTFPIRNRDGSPMVAVERPLLAQGEVRYVGDPVVAIIAETRAQALDAADLVMVEYDELEPVANIAEAMAEGGPAVWPDACPTNRIYDWEHGDGAATRAAFEKASHVTRLRLVHNRIAVMAMEPRAALGEYLGEAAGYRLTTGTQGSHGQRDYIAGVVLGIDPAKLHVITHDVGGGFGMKATAYPEAILTLVAAKQLGRPVKWTADRGESFQSDAAGRDLISEVSLALDAEGRILGAHFSSDCNHGAYQNGFSVHIQATAPATVFGGVYDIPAVHVEVRGYFTNTATVDAYRGAGRPEAAYMLERTLEQAARETGRDPAELRRINMIRPEQLPKTIAAGSPVDSGDFPGTMDRALKAADWAGFETRKSASAAKGMLRGRGLAYYLELTFGGAQEQAELRFTGEGKLTIRVGTQSTGQGHETTFCQLAADMLGIPFEQVEMVCQGDSREVASGGGTGGSRSLQMSGSAISVAGDEIVARGARLAAHLMDTAPEQVSYDSGAFRDTGSNRFIGLFELADKARDPANIPDDLKAEFANGLDVLATFKPEAGSTYPNGCHVCEVEVDPETGVVRLDRYVVVDDFGRLVNPMVVEGQVHGGVVQGAGQALMENCLYEPGTAQLVTGTLMDYGVPRADDICHMTFAANQDVPCTTNPLGIKGCGEAGTIGALPAIMNAVTDAIGTHVDMPATPQAVWQALQAAKGKAAA